MTRRAKNASSGAGQASAPKSAEDGLRFTRWTAVFAGAGVLFAGAGFYLLAQGAINVAPVLLLIAFLGFFPLAVVR